MLLQFLYSFFPSAISCRSWNSLPNVIILVRIRGIFSSAELYDITIFVPRLKLFQSTQVQFRLGGSTCCCRLSVLVTVKLEALYQLQQCVVPQHARCFLFAFIYIYLLAFVDFVFQSTILAMHTCLSALQFLVDTHQRLTDMLRVQYNQILIEESL